MTLRRWGGVPSLGRNSCGEAQGGVEPERPRAPLELDEVQEALWREPDERLVCRRSSRLSAPRASTSLALPHMPAPLANLLHVRILELHRDAHRKRVVQQRIQRDEDSSLIMSGKHERHVESGWVLP